jgi:hypothetical protein
MKESDMANPGCRRFEVPAVVAVERFQELQIEAAPENKNWWCPFVSEVR